MRGQLALRRDVVGDGDFGFTLESASAFWGSAGRGYPLLESNHG